MNFFTVKNIIGLLIVITLISGVVVGVRLVQQQTQLKSKAAEIMAPAPVGLYPCNRPTQLQIGDIAGRCNQPPDSNGCYKTAHATYLYPTDQDGDGVADAQNPGDQPWCDSSRCSDAYNQCPAASVPPPTGDVGVGPSSGQACSQADGCDLQNNLYCRNIDKQGFKWMTYDEVFQRCTAGAQTAQCGSTTVYCWDKGNGKERWWYLEQPPAGSGPVSCFLYLSKNTVQTNEEFTAGLRLSRVIQGNDRVVVNWGTSDTENTVIAPGDRGPEEGVQYNVKHKYATAGSYTITGSVDDRTKIASGTLCNNIQLSDRQKPITVRTAGGGPTCPARTEESCVDASGRTGKKWCTQGDTSGCSEAQKGCFDALTGGTKGACKVEARPGSCNPVTRNDCTTVNGQPGKRTCNPAGEQCGRSTEECGDCTPIGSSTCPARTEESCVDASGRIGKKWCTQGDTSGCSEAQKGCFDALTGGTKGACKIEPTPTPGSRCDYDILDRDGKSVKAGPIYENDRYTFKITMTNTGRAGQSNDWTKSTQWLQALENTASLWGIAQRHELPQDRVAKDASAVFSIDATVRPLSTLDKNFEDRPISFSMAETGTGSFGAACPTEVRVLRKPAGSVATKCYVISENPNEVNNVFSCDDPLAKLYTNNPTVINYTFRNQSPGQKFIFVKFIDVNGRPSDIFRKIVTYSPNPAISNVDCAYDSGSGLTTTYNITGIGFGLRNVDSKLRVGNQNATILRWGSAEIIAQIDQRIEGNTPVQVILEDGRNANGSCTVGTTTATLSVKNQCLSRQFDVDNVEVKIFGSVPEPFARQTIKTDKDGNAQGFTPKLEKNKNYSMIVKAPSTLAKGVVFRTTSGTSMIGPIVLPCGNIAPSPVPDNIINSFDVSALFSQWSLTKDVSRPADLNKDGRVNSVDYAFMKLNFNQQDDVFTLPVVVLLTPSPTPSPSPSPSSTPTPTVSVISCISCAAPPQGCSYVDSKLCGAPGEVTCGELVCATPTPTP